MEIGATLRENRIRQKISIETVEEATKIRAKYLRALENEEWDLLPGRAYVPSFLRTYAQFLGLDSQVLIDAYRSQTEAAARAGDEQYALSEPVLRHQRRRDPGRTGSPALSLGRGPVVGLGVVLLLVSLFALGRWGADDEPTDRATTEPAIDAEDNARSEQAERRRREQEAERRRREQRRQTSTLALRATGPLYVCLQDASGEMPVTGATLEEGDSLGPFRSRRFLLVLGNNNVDLAVDGETLDVAPSATAIGYDVRAGREPASLDADDFPECQ